MNQKGFMGIDLGTSAVKVIIHATDGRTLAKASESYPTKKPRPGWAEQSPFGWWEAVCAAVGKALDDSGAEVAAVGLSSQLCGFVLLDATMRPLADAVIWLDIRAVEETAALARQADFPGITGNPLNAICVLPKLAWFGTHQPELLRSAKRIAFVKDYIGMRLTGSLATDPSDAISSAAAQNDGLEWSPELCALAGIESALLSPIHRSTEVMGEINPDAARETGLKPGTPVATGAGDAATLAVGCGVVEEDLTAITLGTAGHVVAEVNQVGANTGLWRIPHGIPDRQLLLGLIMSGGLSLSWLRNLLGPETPPEFGKLEELATPIPHGCDGLTFLPFLEGAATPYNRPDARGMFFGLSSAHTTGHLVRGVMEGVAFNARQCIEVLGEAGARNKIVRLAEGGARSALWCQILADTLGRPVERIAERDTSAAGAAIIGHAALTGNSVEKTTRDLVRIDLRFKPIARHSDAINAAYSRYLDMCGVLLGGNSKIVGD